MVQGAREDEGGGASPRAAAGLRMVAAGRTHVGLRRRRNEDAWVIAPDLSLLLVADGMGGRADGDLASHMATTCVAAEVAVHEHRQDPASPRLRQLSADEALLADAFQAANERIHDEGMARPDLRRGTMGTTLVAARLSADAQTMTLANVGDSRAYLVRDGRLRLITRDHSLAEEIAAQAPWLPEAIAAAPRNVLTRALGLRAGVTVDVFAEPVCAGDVFVLCTDGLWGHFDEDELARIVADATDLDAACGQLVARANEPGGLDNITVVLARMERTEPRHDSGVSLRTLRRDDREDRETLPDGLDWDE